MSYPAYYRARAEEELEQARAHPPGNMRLRHVLAAEAWEALASRAERIEAFRGSQS
jgi:hypothetical protein